MATADYIQVELFWLWVLRLPTCQSKVPNFFMGKYVRLRVIVLYLISSHQIWKCYVRPWHSANLSTLYFHHISPHGPHILLNPTGNDHKLSKPRRCHVMLGCWKRTLRGGWSDSWCTVEICVICVNLYVFPANPMILQGDESLFTCGQNVLGFAWHG